MKNEITPQEKASELLSKMPNGNAKIYATNMMRSQENNPYYYGFWREVKHILNNN